MSSRTWSNWSGLAQCTPAHFEMPADLSALAAIVRKTAESGGHLRVVGSGHSFTDLVKTSDTIVSLDNLSGVVEADAATATVWAGTKLKRLNELLDERGLAMENLGDINVQSIAGAIGTGTHGTGRDFGCIPTQATGFSLVTASGDVVECSETENTDIFKAAQVSMGTLGVMARIRLRLMPSYRLKYVRQRATFAEFAENAMRWRDENRQFEAYFFPYTETVQLKFLNITEEPPTGRKAAKWFNDVIMENVSFELLSRLCRSKPSRCAGVSKFAAGFVGDSTEIDAGHKVLSTVRFVRFNEMEYEIPAAEGVECLRELKDWIEKDRPEVHFPIEFRYVKGDDIPISPFHGRDSAAISVHMYKGMPHRPYFDGCERIFRAHDGRPHWGKLHSLVRADFEKIYPEWEAFQSIRKRLDPNSVFLNPYLERIFS